MLLKWIAGLELDDFRRHCVTAIVVVFIATALVLAAGWQFVLALTIYVVTMILAIGGFILLTRWIHKFAKYIHKT